MSMLTKLTRKIVKAPSPSELASMRSERATEIANIDREARAAGLPEDEIERLKTLTFREASDRMKVGAKKHFQDQMGKYGKSIGTGIATVGAAVGTVAPVVGAVIVIAGTGVAAAGQVQAAKEAEKHDRELELEAIRKGLPDAVRLASEGKESVQSSSDLAADPATPPGGYPSRGEFNLQRINDGPAGPAPAEQPVRETWQQRFATMARGILVRLNVRRE